MEKTQYSMTRKLFEGYLCGLVDVSKLSVCAYKEEVDRSAEYPKFTTVNLYYLEGKHIASWHKGKAWVFNHVIDKIKAN